MRELSGRARDELSRSLVDAGWEGALPFAEAVAMQCAAPLGGPATHESRDADALAVEAVLAVLRAAAAVRPLQAGELPGTESEPHLERDPILLAAVFQNVDLLYRHGFPHADGVAALVMQALATIDEARHRSA